MCKKCENKQHTPEELAVKEVQDLISSLVTTDAFRDQVKDIANRHNQAVPAVVIQALSVTALKFASAADELGMLIGSFIQGESHFACIGKKNMLTHERDEVSLGGEALLEQTAKALGFTDRLAHVVATAKAESTDEVSHNEVLAKEIMEEAGL